jgi:hypothetical protein
MALHKDITLATDLVSSRSTALGMILKPYGHVFS